MKKITLMLICLLGYISYGQLNVTENFNSGTPAGWTGNYGNTAETACEGNSQRVNMYVSNDVANLTTVNYVGASNGTDLDVSFDYQILDYPAGFLDPPTDATPAGWGTAEVQYSTDDGANWVTALTIDDSNHVVSSSCANISTTIAAANLPNGGDIKIQIVNAWATGDYYFYVDNFVAQQDLGCTVADIGSITTVDDCGNGQYTIDVVVTTAGTATDLSDGTNTYPISGDGVTVTAGPYPSGTAVTLDVVHDLAACDFSLAEQQFFCPPSNDLPANAIALTLDEGTDCGANTITNISNASTTDSGESTTPTCGAYSGGDLWYTFVAPASGQVTLNTTNVTGISSVAGTYYSGTVGSLVEEGCRDFNEGWPWALSGLTPSETYYLRLWDFGNNDVGTFDLCGYFLTCTQGAATAQITDNCDTSADSFFVEVTFSAQNDATGVNDGTTSFAISGGVATAGPYALGTSVDLDVEHSDPNCDFTLGTYTLAVCPPSNDACADAIEIMSGQSISGDTTGATNVEQLPACQGGAVGMACDAAGDSAPNDGTLVFGTGVWYVYNSPGSESISVGDSADSFDSEIQVFSGSCGALVCVAGDDDSEIGNGGFVCFDAPTAETYYIYVDGNAATGTGAYTLNLTTIPFPACLAPTNLSAATQIGDMTANLSWDAEATAVTGYDWAVMANGEDPDVDTPVDAGSTAMTMATAMGLTPGTDYDLYVRSDCDTDGVSMWAGPFDFNATAPPVNDLCSGALTATVGLDNSTTTTGSNVAATDSGIGDMSCTASYDGGDIWYSFTTPSYATEVVFEIITNGFSSTVWSVYDNCTDLNEIDCGTIFGLDSETITGLSASTTYLLRIADFDNDDFGTHEFSLYANVPNDDCSGAIALTLGLEVSGDTAFATDSGVTAGACGPSGGDQDLWYSFVAPVSGEVIFATTADHLVVYDSCGGTEIACVGDGGEATGLTSGSTYFVRVYNNGTVTRALAGPFTLTASDKALSSGGFDDETGFTYYPNPVRNILNLNAQREITDVVMYNMLGQQVMKLAPNTVSTELDMTTLNAGAYFVRVSINDTVQTIRIIKE